MFAKSKRGQVTLFILIGLVLLLATATYLIIQRETLDVIDPNDVPQSLDFIEVNNHMEYCVQVVSEDAVILNGLKGGLYNPAEYSYGFLRPPITKFYKTGDVIAPTKDDVAFSIGQEFLDLMPSCLDTFNGTTEVLTYDTESASVTVRIIDGSIVLSGDYAVMSTKGSSEHTFAKFNYEVPAVRLFTILDLATELSYIQQGDPGYICVTCVVEMADQNFMYIDFTDIGDNTTIYTFTDLFSSINDEPYIFMMGHEH